jgi:hypothetical protein
MTQPAGLPSRLLEEVEKNEFHRNGFVGPFSLLENNQIDNTLQKCLNHIPNLFLSNPLARHTVVPEMAALGRHPQIVKKLINLFGNDLVLWGSQVIRQVPNKKKRFHVDAEFSAIEGVAVWLAMKNVVPKQTLFLIAGSHLLRQSPQEIQKTEGLDLCDSKAVLQAAQKLDPTCKLVSVDIKDGEFVIFEGNLWHGTENVTSRPRYAINLRYTKPSQKVLISKDGELPQSTWLKKQPLCLLVNGKDEYKVNKMIAANKVSLAKGYVGGIYYSARTILGKFRSKL